MEMVSIYEGIILLAGLIGVYIKMQNEVAKLKNRIYTLEESKSEVTDMLKQLQQDLQEIKLLLARKQIDRD
jgi:prefoldin subunit 5